MMVRIVRLGIVSSDGLSSNIIKEARVCSETKIRNPNVSKHGIFLPILDFFFYSFWETVGGNPGTISIAIDVYLVDIPSRHFMKSHVTIR